jgi:hypothetical protein
MRRRDFITLFGGAAAWPCTGWAQQGTPPVVGFLRNTAPDEAAAFVAAFRKGLAETGFVEGRNVMIDYAWSNGQTDRLPALAADLVARQVSVMVALGSTPAIRAERVEWQADFYASCLLMPRKLVFAAWDEAFPDRKQRVLQPTTPIEHPFNEIARDFSESEDQALERFAKPFAEHFFVSPIAMRIRLEKLGLLHRVVPRQRLLAEGL